MRKSKDGGTYETYNDSPWYKYPKRMLQMRARVAFRDLFADAMGGLYIAEEVINGDEAEPIDVTPAKTNGKPKPGDIDYVNLSIPAANEAKARRAAAHKVTSQEQYDKLEPAGVTPLTMSQEAAVALAEAGDYAAKLEPMVTGKPLPPTISRKVTQPTTPAVPAPKLEQDDDGLDIPIGLRRAPVAGLMVDAKKFKIWLNDRFTELQTLAEIRAIWSDLVVPRLRDASDDVHADLMEILEFHERRVMG